MPKIEKLTEQQQANIISHRDFWLNYILSCKNRTDKEKAKKGVEWLYKFCGKKPPVIIWMDSPFGCQIAANFFESFVGKPANIRDNIWANIGDNIWANIRDNIGANIGDNIWANIGDNIWDNIGANIGANIWANIGANIRDNIRANIRDNIGANIWANIRANIWANIGDNIWANIRDNIGANIGDNIWANIGDNIWDNIWANIWANIRDNIGDNIGDNIRDNIGANIGANIWANIGDNIWANIRANIRDNIWANIWANIGDNIWANIRDNIGANIGANIWANIRANIRDNIGDNKKLKYYPVGYRGTIYDYGWVAWIDYFLQNDLIKTDKKEDFDCLKELLLSGVFDMIQLEGLCIVSDMPTKIIRNDRGRLHNPSGPAIEFRDGYHQYYINGRYITDEVFNKSKTLTKKQFIAERNSDHKGAWYEILGQKKMMDLLGAKEVDTKKIVHSNGDIETVTLLKTKERFEEIDNQPFAWVKMICPSTGTQYLQGVEPHHTCALEAIASLSPFKKEEYSFDYRS